MNPTQTQTMTLKTNPDTPAGPPSRDTPAVATAASSPASASGWTTVAKSPASRRAAAKPRTSAPKPHPAALWDARTRQWVFGHIPGGRRISAVSCHVCKGPHMQRFCAAWQLCQACGAAFSAANPGLPAGKFRRCRDGCRKPPAAPSSRRSPTSSTPSIGLPGTTEDDFPTLPTAATPKKVVTTARLAPSTTPTCPPSVVALVQGSCLRGWPLAEHVKAGLAAGGITLQSAAAEVVACVVRAAAVTKSLECKYAPWCHPNNFGALLAWVATSSGPAVLTAVVDTVASLTSGELQGKVLTWTFCNLHKHTVVAEAAFLEWRATAAGSSVPGLDAWYDWLTDASSEDASPVPAAPTHPTHPTPTRPTTPRRDVDATPAPAPTAAAPKPDPALIPDVLTDWDDAFLDANLHRGILGQGFEAPSDVQARCLPAALKGKDVLAQAPSGSGKTAFFAISALSMVDASRKECQAIVVAPTMELAAQSHRVLQDLARHMPGVSVALLSSASDPRRDAEAMRRGGHQVLVCTLGRQLLMQRWEAVRPRGLRLIVVDEADVLLDSDNTADLRSVFQWANASSSDYQVILASATMPEAPRKRALALLRDPHVTLVDDRDVVPAGIRHFTVDIPRTQRGYDAKAELLVGLLVDTARGGKQGVVFVQAKSRADRLAADLAVDGTTVAVVHGGVSPDRRMRIFNDFSKGNVRVLITTDMAARGLDIQGVAWVVNFDTPRDAATYVHRVGRAGRYGRHGVAVTFVQEYSDQRAVMADAQRHVREPIAPLTNVDVEKYMV